MIKCLENLLLFSFCFTIGMAAIILPAIAWHRVRRRRAREKAYRRPAPNAFATVQFGDPDDGW